MWTVIIPIPNVLVVIFQRELKNNINKYNYVTNYFDFLILSIFHYNSQHRRSVLANPM
jgi:hypothetical protein